jgi:ssDNA-binding Zn-finger/Zn-ribbon topoisomerase 1
MKVTDRSRLRRYSVTVQHLPSFQLDRLVLPLNNCRTKTSMRCQSSKKCNIVKKIAKLFSFLWITDNPRCRHTCTAQNAAIRDYTQSEFRISRSNNHGSYLSLGSCSSPHGSSCQDIRYFLSFVPETVKRSHGARWSASDHLHGRKR